ncbi:MAG: transporter substrate-binding domain-containing protein, partial [Erysipelotrichaceae bacterium]|nr:transporter substrate-binding domain-containing protein [Erysipelotrichaceae bacterium]
MKKLFAALTIASMALVGCGSGSSAEDDKTFTVGMECAYQPFNWQTSEETETTAELQDGSGYCDGYDVVIAKKIADDMDMDLQVKKIAWDGLQPALDSGEIDAIIAGMTQNKEREEGIDFTTPYYESDTVMIVRKDSEMASYTDIQQFSGKRVMGQKNTNYDTIIDQIDGVEHQTPKATYPELVVALQNGDTDGITAELPVANGIVAANPDLAIVF